MNLLTLRRNLKYSIPALAFFIFKICYNPAVNSDNSCTQAYLDPGTGAMIVSAIIGIFASVILGVKTFWYKIKRIFKKNIPSESKKPSGKSGS
jgi:hypothetical protein